MNKKKKSGGGFQTMGLSIDVLKGILKKGYNVPTPIQRKTIPLVLEGKDVVAMARTGSGKTAAFLIPLFEKLKTHKPSNGARGLILSPTRELALQTLKFTKEIGKFTGLKAAVILGGDSFEGQFEAIHSNPDIIIATPGRFVHLCVEMNLKLKAVEYIVFDEADRLFELGFSEQLKDITSRIPEVRQTLLFSATLPKVLIEFARAGLSDPALVRLDAESKLSENLQMSFLSCSTEDKIAVLLFVLRNLIKETEQTMIFVSTKHHVEYLHQLLDLVGIENTYIYSSLDQTARKINVAKFQSKKIRCMIVTDVAARGIDIPLLDNVVNFHFPAKSKLFVHRVGRVARAGRSGNAISLVAPDEASYLYDLHLFLSESLNFAPIKYSDEWKEKNKVYGAVPQLIVDNEADLIKGLHKENYDLLMAQKTMNNGYKQYVRTRVVPSKESIKRMKEESWDRTLGTHPIFSQYLIGMDDKNVYELEEQRQSMLNSLKNVRPKTTVFEMSQSKKNKTETVMHEKRRRDQKFIDRFHLKIQDRQVERAEKENQRLQNSASLEMSSNLEIENAFTKASDKKRKIEDANNLTSPTKKKIKKVKENKVTNKKCENVDYKQSEYFIPYTPKDKYADEGYSIGTSFEKEVQQSQLDMVEDEDSSRNNKVKWDRQKKKYVGNGKDKKIKTESGVWISASYKTDKYKKWIERSKKATEKESEDEDENGFAKKQPRKRGFKAIRNLTGKKHPLLKDEKIQPNKRGPKRELKTDDEIQKTRRVAKRRKQHEIAKKNSRKKKKGGFKKKN